MLGILTLIISVAWSASQKCNVPAPENQGDLTYKALIEIINKKKIRSIDDLVPELGNHKDYFTVCGAGESAQADLADLKHPRIIPYGKSANLFIGYVSCEKDPDSKKPYPACETIEVIYRDPENGAATLQEIKLAGKGSDKFAAIESEKNPQRCVHCHGNPPLPIFEAYNLWPGCYGSISAGGREKIDRNSIEGKGYLEWKEFAQKKEAPQRYSRLHWEEREDLDFPADADNNYTKHTRLASSHSVLPDPNGKFTDRAGAMASTSLINYFITHPDFEYFKYTLAGILHCHSGYSTSDPLYADFFPKEMDRNHKAFVEKAKSQMKSEHSRVLKKTSEVNPDLRNPFYSFAENNTLIMEIDYLFSVLGLKSPRLTISKEQKYNSTLAGSTFGSLLRKDLFKSAAYCDSDLWNLLPEDSNSAIKNCARLAEKSRTALLRWKSRNKNEIKSEKSLEQSK